MYKFKICENYILHTINIRIESYKVYHEGNAYVLYIILIL